MMLRRDCVWGGLGLLLLWGGTLGACGARGQAPSATAAGTVLAQFEDARALAGGPRGRLYVADAGRDAVDILEPDGTRRATIGGPGSRPGLVPGRPYFES